MNKSSIFYTITFIFVLATVVVISVFMWIIEIDQQNYTKVLNDKYSLIANARLLYFSGVIDEKEFNEQTKNYKMTLVDSPKEIRQILFYGSVLARAQTNAGLIEIISFEREIYLKIVHQGKLYLYNDADYEGHRYFIIKAIATGVILIFVFLYAFIIKKLRPLSSLKKQIDKFAQNKLEEIKNVSSGNDEISQVSSAFFEAITQIQKMNQSRQFFIRNIMHELKTPITKGLITLEMLENNKYKERLMSIFNRLEILINEFAAIEQITSGAAFINRKKYNILDILDEAKEIAMNDDKNLQIEIKESFFVSVDFKLFTTAIKNMIDNGLKYSQTGFVELEISKSFLIFKNQGKALEKPLEYYTQAFTKGARQKDSFGLGLYIVDTILKAHKMGLGYEYKDGVNYFYFENLENILAKD